MADPTLCHTPHGERSTSRGTGATPPHPPPPSPAHRRRAPPLPGTGPYHTRCRHKQNVPLKEAARKDHGWQLQRRLDSRGLVLSRTLQAAAEEGQQPKRAAKAERSAGDPACALHPAGLRSGATARILDHSRHQFLSHTTYTHNSEWLLVAGRESCHKPAANVCTFYINLGNLRISAGESGHIGTLAGSARSMGLDGAGWDQPTSTTAFAAGPPHRPALDKCNPRLRDWVDQQSTFPTSLVTGIVEIVSIVDRATLCGTQ